MQLSSINDPMLLLALNQGAVGVMPTDTVFGIVARALDTEAVAKLYRLKHREGKPGTVIAANVEQLEALGIDAGSLARVKSLWPGSVSVVLPDHEALDYLDQGKQSLAVRVIAVPALQKLLEKTGPLLTSSANLPGESPAETVEEAYAYFGDDVDFYVATADWPLGTPSTIIRLNDKTIEVLRQGSVRIAADRLRQ